jgi:hypothetical protein
MEPVDASTRVRQFLDTLGPLVTRGSGRRHVSTTTSIGGGGVTSDHGPPEPIPAEFLAKLREVADTPPAASPPRKP